MMDAKPLPFSKAEIEAIAATHPTPFHIYHERGIRETARRFKAAWEWCPGFKEFFAVKATPNPHILKILKEEGFGADCSSLAELVLAHNVKLAGEEIMFTSNMTAADEFIRAREYGAIINLDDVGHIEFLERHAGLPDLVALRYNPGASRTGNYIIGAPRESKFGMTRGQLLAGYRLLREKGVRRYGLHAMVASNELDPRNLVATAKMLFELVVDIHTDFGIQMEFVDIGGGFGIPYRPDELPIDLDAVSDGIRVAYNASILARGLQPVRLYTECGRFLTGPHGFLVTRVRHLKHTYKRYVGLDATMADLMRPGMYGAYHHLTVVGKEYLSSAEPYDVTGSLCENNDKFAIDRMLPELEVGDLVVIHDTGAHGHAMGFNYNGKLRPAELLRRENGEIVQIRRRERLDDYFATLDFSTL